MSDPLITTAARERAITAAQSYLGITNYSIEEITTLVDAILGALPEPAITEPSDKSMLRAVLGTGAIKVFERKDSEAPSEDGILRSWWSYDWKVWLTWQGVVDLLANEEATYTIYAPMQNPS